MASPTAATATTVPAIGPDPQPSPTAPTPQTQVQAFGSDQPLWYQGAITRSRWAQAGYAVPNLAGKNFTMNSGIAELFTVIGRNFFELMHEPDIRFSVPPNIKMLAEVHQLVLRCRQIIAARALPYAQARFDPLHATPNPQVFMVYPVPYFGGAVKQPQIKEWAGLALALLSEMAQHTDNELCYELSINFGAMVGQYMQRIYGLMAIEFFGYGQTALTNPAFVLTPADFAAYDPTKWFTSVEMTDERFDMGWQPNSNDMRAIRGIPANQLVGLTDFPTDLPVPMGGTPTAAAPVTTSPVNPTGAAFPTAPQPAILQAAAQVAAAAAPGATVPLASPVQQ